MDSDRGETENEDHWRSLPREFPYEGYSLAPSGDLEKREQKEQVVPLHGRSQREPPIERALYAIRHFDLVIGPEGDLVEEWEEISEKEQRMYCAGVLQRLFEDDYRELEERLSDWGEVAREAGFSPSEIPHYSTFSRHLRDLDDNVLEEATRRAGNAALHAQLPKTGSFKQLGPNPSKPKSYYEFTGQRWEASYNSKMSTATKIVAEYMALASGHLSFDRDRSAPNHQYPLEEFYRLLAHIALEDCYAKNGREILQWHSDDDINVPPPWLLQKYARQYEVEDLEEKFIKATCGLLEREGLLPPEPVNLAYDVTKVRWYGDDHEWTSGGRNDSNTTEFWHYAVLSISAPDRNYVLGATPIKKKSETADALRRLLRRVNKHVGFDIGQVYFDRQMYRKDIVTICREIGANFLIQAKDTGDPGNILERAEEGEYEVQDDINFTTLTGNKRVNAFAYPIHPGEIGSDKRDESHTAWITDHDVEDDETDLRKLAYQFRNRWRVETAIRQLKHDFQGRCGSSDRAVRTMYFGAAQLFFNFWVALNHELPYKLGEPENFRLTGQETLHAIREADFEAGKRGSYSIP